MNVRFFINPFAFDVCPAIDLNEALTRRFNILNPEYQMEKYDPYRQWIEKFHRTNGLLLPNGLYSIAGRCYQATRLMVEVFPELDRVEGDVEIGGDIGGHAWCVIRETGEIVDPTISQYFGPLGPYVDGTPIRYITRA